MNYTLKSPLSESLLQIFQLKPLQTFIWEVSVEKQGINPNPIVVDFKLSSLIP